MTQQNEYNIGIMGCGFSGMIIAQALSNMDHIKNITVFEKQDTSLSKFYHDIRTTALTSNSYNFLDKIGITEQLNQYLTPISDIYVVDNKSENMIHFDPRVLLNLENMGYIIHNSYFKKILFDKTSNDNKVTIIDNFNYHNIKNHTDTCIIFDQNNKKYEFDLLILCEGFNSKAKNHFFTPKLTKSYEQSALTFIVRHDKPHEGTAVEHFMPSGPFAILPLTPDTESSIVWTVCEDYKNLLLQLPQYEFTHLVQESFGQFLGKIKVESEIASYPLHSAVTANYYNNRIVLAGNSAHVIHPLAGQGLNQGIKDIKALSRIISHGGINKNSLHQYQMARAKDNMNMFELTDIINTLFSNYSKPLFIGRKIAFTAIDKLSFIKKQIVKYASGL